MEWPAPNCGVALVFFVFFLKLILIRLSLSPISLCDLSNWCVSCRESIFFSFSFPANWELYYYSNCYYRVAQRYICGNIAGARLTHIIAAGAHKTCGNQKLVNKSRKNPKTFQKEKPHIYHIWLFFDLFTDLLFFFFFFVRYQGIFWNKLRNYRRRLFLWLPSIQGRRPIWFKL